MLSRATTYELDWASIQVGSAQAGQQWVLSAMQKHGAVLVHMLWRILGNEQDVADAYQETFLRLAHFYGGRAVDRRTTLWPLKHSNRPDNIKAYLFRTASNVAISMLRQKKAQDRLRRTLAESLPKKQPSNCGDDLDLKQLCESLREHIARLPEHLHNAVVLRDLAELPYQQVADILGVSSASARVYRCRAIQLLAASMAGKKDK